MQTWRRVVELVQEHVTKHNVSFDKFTKLSATKTLEFLCDKKQDGAIELMIEMATKEMSSGSN